MGLKIIKQLTQGDDIALDTMIRDYYPKIFAYLYRRLIDETLAKDLTQETFYHFFEHIQDYQDQGKLLNYLYRIAQHVLYDHLKSRKPITIEWDEGHMGDHKYDGHELFERKEETILVRKWIKKLPLNLQDIIYFRFYEKMKFKDISKITGIHASTLKSQLKLALKMLEKMMKEEGWK